MAFTAKAERVLRTVVELALAGRITDKGVISEDCDRIRAVALEPEPSATAVLPRHAALGAALLEACEQIEGWVAWKCPRKYKLDHLANIARLRAIAGYTPPVTQPAPVKVADMEVLDWIDPSDPKRPDAEQEVFCHFRSQGIVVAFWDEESGAWRDPYDGLIINDELLGWAEPRGVTSG